MIFETIRDTFVALPEHVLIFIDLSRVEDRVTQMYAGQWAQSPEVVALANDRVTDTHALNAKAIMRAMGHSENAIEEHYAAYLADKKSVLGKAFKSFRQKAKKVTHGAQRAMGARKLSESFFVEGVTLDVKTCQRMIDAYLDANPELLVYRQFVEEYVRRDFGLTNCFGRRIMWPYLRFSPNRLDGALLRKAYSFLPQSVCADVMNVFGIIDTYRHIRENALKTRIIAQVHDEIILMAPHCEAYGICCFVKTSLEREFRILDETLSVPADVSVGVQWGRKTEIPGDMFDGMLGNWEKFENIMKGVAK